MKATIKKNDARLKPYMSVFTAASMLSSAAHNTDFTKALVPLPLSDEDFFARVLELVKNKISDLMFISKFPFTFVVVVKVYYFCDTRCKERSEGSG